MVKRSPYMPKSKNQEHLTPDRVFELIEEEWGIERESFNDPCPAGTPFKAPCFFNGLYGNWPEWNYVNSPFDVRILEAFVKKVFGQRGPGRLTVILLPVKTDQDWFHDYVKGYICAFPNNVHWIRKRLKFKNDKDSSMNSHFLVLVE